MDKGDPIPYCLTNKFLTSGHEIQHILRAQHWLQPRSNVL